MSLFSLEALKILEPDTCLKPPISVQVSKTSTHVSWSLVINEETLWQKYCVSLLVFAQISEKSEVGWAVRFPDLKAMERASRELKQGQFSWDSPRSTSLEFSKVLLKVCVLAAGRIVSVVHWLFAWGHFHDVRFKGFGIDHFTLVAALSLRKKTKNILGLVLLAVLELVLCFFCSWNRLSTIVYLSLFKMIPGKRRVPSLRKTSW